eukprot:COSAG03_NODE_2119_length_3105_cov_3.504657_2_plen_227_part_00
MVPSLYKETDSSAGGAGISLLGEAEATDIKVFLRIADYSEFLRRFYDDVALSARGMCAVATGKLTQWGLANLSVPAPTNKATLCLPTLLAISRYAKRDLIDCFATAGVSVDGHGPLRVGQALSPQALSIQSVPGLRLGSAGSCAGRAQHTGIARVWRGGAERTRPQRGGRSSCRQSSGGREGVGCAVTVDGTPCRRACSAQYAPLLPACHSSYSHYSFGTGGCGCR